MTKVCSKCKVEKSKDSFDRKKGYKDGIYCWCKECRRAHDNALWHKKSKENKLHIGRKYNYKTKYGISLEKYEELLVAQNHKCAICGKDEVEVPKKRLCVDHCHTTGKVRGLLCHYCNIAIGHMFDSTENLNKAVQYLEGAD